MTPCLQLEIATPRWNMYFECNESAFYFWESAFVYFFFLDHIFWFTYNPAIYVLALANGRRVIFKGCLQSYNFVHASDWSLKMPAVSKIPLDPKQKLHKGEELPCLRWTDRKTRTSFLKRESEKTSHRELQIGRMHWKRKQEIKNSYIGVSPTFL